MVLGNKQYKTKQFTVTVEPHNRPDLLGTALRTFKWVRIYANCRDVAFCSSGSLLLGCKSGTAPASELIRMAKNEARIKLKHYKNQAKKILEINLD
jgi:hypothetical protein